MGLELKFDSGATDGRSYEAMPLVPTMDQLESFAMGLVSRGVFQRLDAQQAPIWAEKLRHTFAKVFEVKYPELAAANGDVLPIDSSVDPASLVYEYFQMDTAGSAYWIDDEGSSAPSSAIVMKRFVGEHHELGHEWDVNIFDLERADAVGLGLVQKKNEIARKTHDRWTNWVWLCGEPTKVLLGILNHPNITKLMAPLNAGTTSRLLVNKSVDEILADFNTLINTCANNTIGAYYTGTVYMPRNIWQKLNGTRLGAGDGFASILDLLKNRFSGDESGQGKVTFKILNECQGTLRLNPNTGTDTSGVVGDILLAVPNAPKDELCFIRSRPFTQLPPQELKFRMHNFSHSKIGGTLCKIPTAVVRMEFGLT